MGTVFLTGANGHIGANVARELLRRGHRVVGYVRPTSDLRGLEGLEIDLRKGDIQDADQVTRAAEGCDAIIHTAAVYIMWAPTDEAVTAPGIRGTENVLRAAREHGRHPLDPRAFHALRMRAALLERVHGPSRPQASPAP